jgi:GDP-L-fucose synthase
MEKNARIYVAGHNGMVGSAIVRELIKQGYSNILVQDHKSLDLTNQDKVEGFFKESRPEYVFIAAAKVGGIKANAESPADFLMENLIIQNNILSSAFKYNIKKLMFLGSSCIYPKECQQPIKESEILTGPLEVTNEPYAIAKIAGIKACNYYNRQYNTNFISVMPANCYGVNDCFDVEKAHVIPALIRKYHSAKMQKLDKVILWGTGNPLREFLYVDDLSDACVFLMNCYDGREPINIGSDSEISILELSELIRKIVGFEGKIECDTQKPDGMMRRIVDSGRIHQLGWYAKTNIEEGIRRTYEYFLKEVLCSEEDKWLQ